MGNAGEGIIARPLKVYLDTNHLINIAKARAGENLPQGQSSETYLFIDEYVRNIAVLFSVGHRLWSGWRVTQLKNRQTQ